MSSFLLTSFLLFGVSIKCAGFDVEPLREAAKSSGLLSAVQNAIQNHKDEPTIQAIGKQIRAAS